MSLNRARSSQRSQHVDMAAATDKPLSKGVIFGTSGLGGIAGWICVHPFNTLAVRMNLASMSAGAGEQVGFATFASNLIKAEGFMSLYSGLGAGCLRQVFYATSRYGLFETFRDMCAKYRKTDFAQRFATASVAGGCAAVISCPIEVCLVRMSNDASLPPDKQRGYKSVFDAIIRIAKEDGLGAFYRGVQPFAMRAMLVGGTQVATYDQFKDIYGSMGLKGLANQFCSSMSAGAARVWSRCPVPLSRPKAHQCTRARPHARRSDLLDRDDALRDGEEPHGLPKARPGHKGDAVPQQADRAFHPVSRQRPIDLAGPPEGPGPFLRAPERHLSRFEAWHGPSRPPPAAPTRERSAVHHQVSRHDADHRGGRARRRRLLALVGLHALLRPLWGAHRHDVHLRRPVPPVLQEEHAVVRPGWCGVRRPKAS